MLTFYLGVFIFIMGIISFVLSRKHLLSILLSLEYIVLSLFIILISWLILLGYQEFFRIIFLIFSVCEGALGLSILVSLIRTHGNDYFQSFRGIQC